MRNSPALLVLLSQVHVLRHEQVERCGWRERLPMCRRYIGGVERGVFIFARAPHVGIVHHGVPERCRCIVMCSRAGSQNRARRIGHASARWWRWLVRAAY